MGGAGFEPAKAEPTDLQSVPFDRFGNPPKDFTQLLNKNARPRRTSFKRNQAISLSESQRRDLNPQPAVYKTAALPIELRWPVEKRHKYSQIRIPRNTKRQTNPVKVRRTFTAH